MPSLSAETSAAAMTEPPSPSRVRRPQRWLGFAGAGCLVAVGYTDPGNWATAIAGGARYGYTLLSVVLLSSMMALFLQWIAARVGLVAGQDLAQLCRARYGRRSALALWLLCEVAIIATDLAEIIGSAVALQLLLGISLPVGVLLASVLAFAMLAIQMIGQRSLEGVVAAMILFAGGCFVAQLAMANPDWQVASRGLVPRTEIIANAGLLWIACGILGATVMPHNLYLHSNLLRNRGQAMASRTIANMRQALRATHWDTSLSLAFAFCLNASLLILAASVFHFYGHIDVESLGDAHRLLSPLLGNHWAGLLFACALLACGLSSTITATLAGQAVMEGFLNLRIKPWQRALLTRSLAIIPAMAVAILGGEGETTDLLVLSQVILSLQLPFAVIPLVRFASDHALMGQWRLKGPLQWLAWAVSAVIVLLNMVLLWQVLGGA